MPRQNAYLRMIDVDDETGELITSYANIVENSHGPRMALVIDPGDGAYAGRARSTPGADAATGTAPVWQAAPVAQPIALAKPAWRRWAAAPSWRTAIAALPAMIWI
jgi:hypothetical protein